MTSAIPVRCSTNWAMKPHIGSKVNLLSLYCGMSTGRNELNKLTLLPMCGFIAQLVEHRSGIAEVMGSNPVEALIFFFFQASSFQLLKLENLLRWSHFTFISYRSTNMNYFIYISHKFAPVSWRSWVRIPLKPWFFFFFFFRLLLSNCLNWKIYCDDHTSLSSHTAVQIWIISYIFHKRLVPCKFDV